MKVVRNYTPHTINLNDFEIESSGVARCEEKIKELQPVTSISFNTIKIISKSFGEIIGLPKPYKNYIYIVSHIVGSAARNRDDLYTPGELIRNEKGQVVGCKNLTKVNTSKSLSYRILQLFKRN